MIPPPCFRLRDLCGRLLIRPFGAVIFGRIGDLVGRKYTFLVTIFVMGLATFAVGLLPTFGTQTLPLHRSSGGHRLGGPRFAGDVAPVAGLGARRRIRRRGDIRRRARAPGERGYATSWIQTTATLGFFLSLFVIGACRFYLFDAKAFAEWGWRVPFLVSSSS